MEIFRQGKNTDPQPNNLGWNYSWQTHIHFYRIDIVLLKIKNPKIWYLFLQVFFEI